MLSSFNATKVIFDFNRSSDLQDWTIVDDVVMGGVSSSNFTLNEEGHGVFKGEVSLENNGGFCSVRYEFPQLEVEDYTKVLIKCKGDGKMYQFRVKANSSDDHSYVASFETSGEWEEIEISLKDMYPSFRGRKLELSNFSNDHMEEIGFLIGNKKNEEFKLMIDKIVLQ